MSVEFEVIQIAEGGYAAACFQERIFAEADTLSELYEIIHNGLLERFPDVATRPALKDVKWIVYQEPTFDRVELPEPMIA